MLSIDPTLQKSIIFFGSIVGAIVSFGMIVSVLTRRRFDYRGKHVLVTGGSSGIGLELAKQYLQRGANVSIVARNKDKLKQAKELLDKECKQGNKILTVSVDIGSSLEGVKDALKGCLNELGEVDVLINNAGTSIAGVFEDLSPKDFSTMYNVNVLGSVHVMHAVLPGMKAKHGSKSSKYGGRIVFVASQVAQVAIHGYTAYAASKWAVRGMAEALQMEVKPYNIYVSVAYPPDTDTPGYELEMTTKPELTKKISESGTVFSPASVANDILVGSTRGTFHISSGLDGYLLKLVHPGMSPVNDWVEVLQPLLLAPLARFIALFYLLQWDSMCAQHRRRSAENKKTK